MLYLQTYHKTSLKMVLGDHGGGGCSLTYVTCRIRIGPFLVRAGPKLVRNVPMFVRLKMELTFLGTGSAYPTPSRGVSCVVYRNGNMSIVFLLIIICYN